MIGHQMNHLTPLKQPAIFIGHGNPMNAITPNPHKEAWVALGLQLKNNAILPRAILCISAHWQTQGTWVCAANQPKTIHDFGGFPKTLFEQQYPAPGAPDIAQLICDFIPDHRIKSTLDWGLDHGAWTVLQSIFPAANIPVLQLSLDRQLDFKGHFALAQQLSALREQGILVMGSGNIVHNLGMLAQGHTYDWAISFDEYIKNALLANDNGALINIAQAGAAAQLSVPSDEHYLPLLYIAAMRYADDRMQFFTESFDLASLSMRSFIYQ
jgi:4,5-DOPA dioxygenase extradiol